MKDATKARLWSFASGMATALAIVFLVIALREAGVLP